MNLIWVYIVNFKNIKVCFHFYIVKVIFVDDGRSFHIKFSRLLTRFNHLLWLRFKDTELTFLDDQR